MTARCQVIPRVRIATLRDRSGRLLIECVMWLHDRRHDLNDFEAQPVPCEPLIVSATVPDATSGNGMSTLMWQRRRAAEEKATPAKRILAAVVCQC